jgi:hypothetical protein
MVVQLRSQLKALSINTQSPSTSTSTTTTKRTGTSTATSKKLQREDNYDDSEPNVNARASGLPTPDITPLKARIQRQPSGNTSLTGALIISELPSSPQSVATPTITLPSVGKKLKKKAKKAAALAAKASTDSGSVAATTSDGALKKGKKKKKSKSKKATTTATKNATSEAKQGKAGQVDRSMVLEASTYITSYVL